MGGQQMSATVDKLPEANKLHIGEGVTINGAVVTSGTVIVEGVLQGDISIGNLIVGETGNVQGRINVAQNAEILGAVSERLNVKGLLILRSSSRVDGNVSCGVLQIEQGASITGGIHPTDYQGDQQNFRFRRQGAAGSADGASTLQRLDQSARSILPEPQAFRNSRSL
jgi:cytoskeletal protein CcmA (bactofilin family)